MATRVGINGFGRIGRLVLRAIISRYPEDLDVVAINDLADPETNSHMFKYDSNYGVFHGTVGSDKNSIIIDGNPIKVLSERSPSSLNWSDHGVDIVIESTGIFTDANVAKGHLDGGAKKVIISAPASNEDATLVLGVNENIYNTETHNIVSNASCTTNCVATLVKVLDDSFGVQQGLMTTVHSYTGEQMILDKVHKDLRRARSAAMNIVPTTTGAAKAVGLVLPELNGRIHGMALRVPTSTVSITDFVATLNRAATVEAINESYKQASQGALSKVLEYTDQPLVSSDFKQNPSSCIIDGLSTMVMDGNMAKVVGWYDNEWGYSCRTADLTSFIAGKGL